MVIVILTVNFTVNGLVFYTNVTRHEFTIKENRIIYGLNNLSVSLFTWVQLI